MQNEALFKQVQFTLSLQPFVKLLGIELITVEPGRVTLGCESRPELTQQNGFIHGGVISSIADLACGAAAVSMMDALTNALTVEFKINYLRPAAVKKLLATGTVVKSGKTLTIVDITITDETGEKIIAKALGTMIASTLSVQFPVIQGA